MMDGLDDRQVEDMPEAGNGDSEDGAPGERENSASESSLPEDTGEGMGTADEEEAQDQESPRASESVEETPEPEPEPAPVMEVSASDEEESPEPASPDEPVAEVEEESEPLLSEEDEEALEGEPEGMSPMEAFVQKFTHGGAGGQTAKEEMEEEAEAVELGEDVSPLQAFAHKFAIDEPAEGAEPEEAVGGEEGEAGDGRSWYVVHCYSGYENKVRHNLEQRIESMGMKDLIFDVVVPTEEEIEVKEGRRRTVERRVFPGYILVNMVMTEESWYVVRNTPGVTSFVGMGNDPTPLRPEEVSQIVKRMEADAPRIKVTFKPGERVRIMDGPFNDFRGTVSEIDMERAKVRVMVNFFGRETPVELDFLQVEKA